MITFELTQNEAELLLHFAQIGQSHIHVRNNYGDREVAFNAGVVIQRLMREVNKQVAGC